MKTILKLALLFLMGATCAHAQSTTVSGTITDPNGQAFIDGTYRIEFNANGHTGPFYWNGSPFTPSVYAGGLDGSGAFAGIVVPSSTSISPSGTNWKFTMCPASSSPCYTQGISLSGSSLDVSTIIKPPAIIIQSNAYNQPVAYQDAENLGPVVGYSYFNHTLQHYRVCTSQVPCSWLTICFQGDGLCGGGPPPTGCSVTGLLDTNVLFIHPAATCDATPDWTWDFTNTNMQAGDGTNVVGASDTFTFGESNTMSSTLPTESAIIGDHNSLSYQNEKYIIGTGNSSTGIQSADNYIIGEGNSANSSGVSNTAQQLYIMGNTNATTGHACFVNGFDNTLGENSVTHNTANLCGIMGEGNSLSFSGGSSNTNVTDFYLVGENNSLTESSALGAGLGFSNINALGDDNTFEDDINVTEDVEVVGEQNDVDGALSTLQILGFQNIAHNVTSATLGDTVIVGAENHVTHVANTNNTYAGTVGFTHTLQNCDNCMLFGFNGNENGSGFSNSVGLGMSATPEVVVTPGAVAVTYLGASAPSVCTNSSKVLITSGCPSIIGVQSQTYNTLASDSAISSSTPTDIFLVHGSDPTLTMPASGCPCKIAVSYFMYIKQPQNSNDPTDFWVYDGTNVYASSDFRGDGNGMGASQTSQVNYANGVTVTLQLMTEAAQGYTIAKSMAFSPQGSWFEAHVVTSN